MAVRGFHHEEQRLKPVPTEDVTWAPEAVWALCKRNQRLVSTGNRTTFVQMFTHSLGPIPTILSWLPVEYDTFVYVVICRTSCSFKKKLMTVIVQHISRTRYAKVGTKLVPLILFSQKV